MIDYDTDTTTQPSISMAATVAPDDLHCGDYVSLLNETVVFPSWMWDCDLQLGGGNEFVHVQLPACEAGTPLKVKSICLPFVLVKTPKGKHRTIDIRNSQLVRLSLDYARQTWAALGKRKKSKKRK